MRTGGSIFWSEPVDAHMGQECGAKRGDEANAYLVCMFQAKPYSRTRTHVLEACPHAGSCGVMHAWAALPPGLVEHTW